jgi:hypothetical protein
MSVFNLAQKRSFPPLCVGSNNPCQGIIDYHKILEKKSAIFQLENFRKSNSIIGIKRVEYRKSKKKKIKPRLKIASVCTHINKVNKSVASLGQD